MYRVFHDPDLHVATKGNTVDKIQKERRPTDRKTHHMKASSLMKQGGGLEAHEQIPGSIREQFLPRMSDLKSRKKKPRIFLRLA